MQRAERVMCAHGIGRRGRGRVGAEARRGVGLLVVGREEVVLAGLGDVHLVLERWWHGERALGELSTRVRGGDIHGGVYLVVKGLVVKLVLAVVRVGVRGGGGGVDMDPVSGVHGGGLEDLCELPARKVD